jgi:hypothetical protein
MSDKRDWYDLIVGGGNVNEGLGRMVGSILLFIVVVGLIFWMIYPN